MKRTLITILLVSLGVVGLLSRPASATHLCDPQNAGGYVVPDGTPCSSDTAPPTTAEATKYCLGYAQSFPVDKPCPAPPPDSCVIHPDEFACHDPSRGTPVAPVANPEGTAPPQTTTTTTVEPSDDVSGTTTPIETPRPVQRRSAPPRKRVVTTTTTLPPLFFVLGQWLTYDEFVACIDLMGP